MLVNLFKAVVAAAVTPVTLVADLATLPSSAYNNRGPFDRTARKLQQSSAALDAALQPKKKNE
jgi:hypothetical protein